MKSSETILWYARIGIDLESWKSVKSLVEDDEWISTLSKEELTDISTCLDEITVEEHIALIFRKRCQLFEYFFDLGHHENDVI